ncbi:hypothetical protein F441_08959 [Phytophthora nicotianae CJ01A1]|uniref:Uncharacterized protein n=3 Tax=Phytophthora nicotianae TaxID=4792 RepID=W2ZE61_PHYNI|nr:hypothetical protein L915_08816 [Phytophthora nicotianae]ETL39974.1 hypothetical protein L916_08744 [Phytophthora nicotianae]ETL93099.1 hypothetical protein L917_08664 [Phytophthora nicotianae]ETP16428.1 hypothetical protein F441_08959 [Phytophthora nicotianae CJ01A1]ETP44474.1 hypothetical protein F442_08931 [Phytophthora nicotianae P10297]
MKSRNDWWLDGEESHMKDRTERAVESGRQKILATATDAKTTSKSAGEATDAKMTQKSVGEATDDN